MGSLSDVSSFNMERVISIKGSIENMSRAEAMISAKLRQSYESDLQVDYQILLLHQSSYQILENSKFPYKNPEINPKILQ